MRKTLLMAAAVAALMATPALAQEVPASDPASQPPSTDPVGTAPAAEIPEAIDAVDETAPEATVTATPETDAALQAAEFAEAGSTNDIVDVMRADGQFTILLLALDATGLTATLESDESISILAPTDAAFAALPAGELDRLMLAENREELQELLLYHVINADVRAEQIENRRGPVVTGAGAQVLLDGVGGLRADGATITNADLRGSNGGVLVVDQVLNPSTSLAAQGDEDAEATGEAETDAPAATETETPAATEMPAATDTPDATEEPTGEAMPSTPPVDEVAPTEPTDEEDPTTPQS